MAESEIQKEYIPVEYFLGSLENLKVVSWISENIGCLRAVFKIYDNDADERVKSNNLTLKIINKDGKLSLKSNNIVGNNNYKDYKVYHMNDGTVVLFTDEGKGYHFCFEECSDSTFHNMLS